MLTQSITSPHTLIFLSLSLLSSDGDTEDFYEHEIRKLCVHVSKRLYCQPVWKPFLSPGPNIGCQAGCFSEKNTAGGEEMAKRWQLKYTEAVSVKRARSSDKGVGMPEQTAMSF